MGLRLRTVCSVRGGTRGTGFFRRPAAWAEELGSSVDVVTVEFAVVDEVGRVV